MPNQKEYYNEKSHAYESGMLFERTNRNHIKKIEELLNIRDSSNYYLLEVGLGTGIHTKYVLEIYQDISYKDVDISAGMIAKAREKLSKTFLLKNINHLASDGKGLPFNDNSFDATYISGSLHHSPHLYLCLSELLRVLKPRDRFALMEPNWLFPTNIWAAITNRSKRNILNVNRLHLKRWVSQLRIDNFIINNTILRPRYLKAWLRSTPILAIYSLKCHLSPIFYYGLYECSKGFM